MSWLRRKWRSVSFRSGLGASLIVGVIVSFGLLVLSATVFITLFSSNAAIQVSLVNRIEDQLKIGVPPGEIVIDDLPEPYRQTGFWAITRSAQGRNGAVVGTGGDFSQAVIDKPFDEITESFNLELPPEAFDSSGTKTVEGVQWLVVENDVSVDNRDYRVIAGSQGQHRFGAFLRDGLPITIPIALAVMTVAGVITSWFTRRALSSVEKMRLEVEQITQESLSRRVPTTGARDRIDKLAETMNDMLARLESSSVQQNQFLADASHELRSPVAGLLAQLDVAATYPDRADTATLLPKLQGEAQRLQLVVDDLLFLGRTEGQRRSQPAGPVAVSLSALLANELDHQQMMNPNLTIERHGSPEVKVVGVERDLQRALRNLADNACRHANHRVVLGMTEDGANVKVTVTDDGHGVSAEHANKIFDRFVRLDESRARDAGGSGLGLAIVREIIEAHGGTVALESDNHDGATFTIRLPVTRS